jgi:hypothetical protein
MPMLRINAFCLVLLVAVVSGMSHSAVCAETTIEMKGFHDCCPSCEKAINKAVESIDGAKVVIDEKGEKLSIPSKDAEVAQKALDALAAAGVHGQTNSADIKIKDDKSMIIMCCCESHDRCHRRVIIDELAKRTGVEVDRSLEVCTTFLKRQGSNLGMKIESVDGKLLWEPDRMSAIG